jgi:hypothetical protein
MSGAETVVVTPFDQDAAQALCASGWTHAGEAFARHRLAAQADALAVMREAEGALEAVAPYLNTMLIEDDPDDESIGWEDDGDGGHTKPIDFTMGQIRKVNTTLANLRAAIARMGGAA